MATTPSYTFSLETRQRPGSFGERFEDITRKHLEGFRSRSLGKFGSDSSVGGTRYYKTEAEALAEIESLEEQIGKDIMLSATQGVASPSTIYSYHVRLIDVSAPAPSAYWDSFAGDGYKVDYNLTVKRMA